MHSEDWSDWADTHVDLIFPWEPSHFVGFVMRWHNYGKSRSNQNADYLPTGAVAQLLDIRFASGRLWVRSRVIPKTFKMVLAALSFALSTEKAELVGPVSV